MKKWMIIVGVLLLSVSQGRHGFDGYLQEFIFVNLEIEEFTIVSIPVVLLMDIFTGFFNVLDNLWHFLLSWEGVLFVAVVLLYIGYQEHIKSIRQSD